jgi:hypothetical protein
MGERLDPSVEAALYFVCVNALRGAHGATLEVTRDDAAITCHIAGVDGQETEEIRDRIEAIGGTLAFQGTELVARVPARVLELVG